MSNVEDGKGIMKMNVMRQKMCSSMTYKVTAIMASIVVAFLLFFIMNMETVRAAAIAEGTCGPEVTWELDENGTLTISGSGEIQACDWNSAPWYENRLSITSVIIEEGITVIGNGAFENCENLIAISFPNTLVSMGEYTFSNCTSLESIVIPSSISELGNSVLRGCKSLQTLVVPENITRISNYAFYECSGLQEVYISPTLESIGDRAFWYVDSATFYLKKGSYADNYFKGDSTKPIVYTCQYGHTWNEFYTVDVAPTEDENGMQSIHCSVCDSVKEGTSQDVSFEKAILDRGTCGSGLTWELTYSGILTISGTGDMQDCGYGSAPWYDYLPKVKSVIIEEGVESIGRGAFENFYNIEAVSLPSTVGTIGGGSFAGCKKLKEISIPEIVKTIEGSAFSGCLSLEEIEIPQSVNTINGGAFWDCNNLKSVTIPDSVFLIGDRAFYNVSAIFKVKKNSYADTYLQEAGKNIQYICDYGHIWNDDYTVDIEPTATKDGIESIHCSICNSIKEGTEKEVSIDDALRGKGKCGESLTWSLNYSDVLTITGSGDMQYCGYKSAPWYEYRENIVKVKIDSGVTSVGVGAFEDCINLKSVEFPKSVLSIGNWAFGRCQSLEQIEIPSKLTTIEYGTFIYCSSLKQLEIPVGVTSIGYNAFYDCNHMQELYIPDTVQNIGEYTFTYIPGNIYVKKGSYAEQFLLSENTPFVYTCKYGHVWDEEYTIDTAPTCTETGLKSIHCAACGEIKEDTTEVVDATGHTFGDWVVITPNTCENSGLKQRSCTACGLTESENLDPKGHDWEEDVTVDVKETCTSDGSKSIHCANCDATKDSEVIPATGHSWLDPTYTWSDDNSTCIATRVCQNDASHEDSETVTTTSKITKKATYTAKGETTYTAAFANEAFATQTKTVVNIPKLAKKTNTMKVTTEAKSVKFTTLKKKALTVAPITVKNTKGTVTYKLISGTAKAKKALTLNKTTGKIKVRKGSAKGTYRLKIKVTAAGTTVYKAASKTVTITVKVK